MTAADPRARRAPGSHRRPSLLHTRHWRVPTKLAAVLTVPLLGFLAVTGIQITESVRTAAALGGFSDQVAMGVEVTDLVHELQRERDHTVGMLAALAAPGPAAGRRDVGALAPDRTAVDRAAARLRTAARPLLDDPALAATYQRVESRLDQLAQVRLGVAEGWLRTQAVFDMYTGAIADLHALLPRPVDVEGDTELGRFLRGLSDLARAKELASQVRGQLYMLTYGVPVEPGAFGQIADLRAQRQTAVQLFRSEAAPEQVSALDDTVAGQAVRNADRLERAIVGDGVTEHGVEPQQWWSASTTELQLMRTLEQALLQTAVSEVDDASGVQWRTTALRSLTTAGLLLAALLMSIAIGRSMAATLRSLREQALIVADIRLPRVIAQLRRSPTTPPPLRVEPIRVDSRDEVAEVAEAFTAVHRSAVRLAAEQAVMRRNVNEIFIKLALRSQSLVERQLTLLDTMESSEVDPDKLSSLFRLDHLAARLRRNDENLLVLAGGDTSRRWNEPKDLNTIVLAAAAEVEHYERVRHQLDATVYVVGHAVADVVNLLAELLENGLAFSPPETLVHVRGHALADGSAELVITDDGIGMSAQALAEANDQVSMPVSIDISAAERMGLVVVGHLAHRHRISIHLDSGTRGVTVSVNIPAALIVPAPPEPLELPRDGGGEAGVVPPTHRRSIPTRAEDVLTPDRHKPSIWWSPDTAAAAASTPATAPTALGALGLGRTPSADTAPSDTAEPGAAPPAVSSGTTAPGTTASGTDPTGTAPGDLAAPGTAPLGAAPSDTTAPDTVPAADAGPVTPEPAAVTKAGLPIRRRAANLPGPSAARPATEADPDAVSDTLNRLYEGLRRAEAEEEMPTGVTPGSAAGPAGEEAAPGTAAEDDKVSTVRS
ncbi:nitrate- and nitrite sensing domain-containing protein [Catellatospora sp. NPDC049609]|uniref:sensor histidine kinase n=1 Tax=Catellatospora sp. NPDC049609 TaxID=3155505 RepID=UPI00341894B2